MHEDRPSFSPREKWACLSTAVLIRSDGTRPIKQAWQPRNAIVPYFAALVRSGHVGQHLAATGKLMRRSRNQTPQCRPQVILDKTWWRFAESNFRLLLHVTSISDRPVGTGLFRDVHLLCDGCRHHVAGKTSAKPVAIACLRVADSPNLCYTQEEKNIEKGRGGTYTDFFSRPRRDHTTRSLLPRTHKQRLTLRGRSFASFWKPLLNSLHIKTTDRQTAAQTVCATAALFQRTGQQTLAS